ncbi:hypothetical protein QCA50_003381 [Cerrena zonata]|uniref:Uncharacterized protein n=1 Tax=Cerrena zonata TaxID=2478898 RepID=A0AAW0GPQ9_9APHY
MAFQLFDGLYDSYTPLRFVLLPMPVFHSLSFVLSCRLIGIARYSIILLTQFAAAGFNCMRVWSMCQQRWTSRVIAVFILSLSPPCMNIYNISRPRLFTVYYATPLAGCLNTATVREYTYRALLEVVVTFGTGFKIHHACKILSILIKDVCQEFFYSATPPRSPWALGQ